MKSLIITGPSKAVNGTVDISGEVNYPGNYAVGDNETINDLINRAGGLKDTAFRQGAVFLRESIKEDEADRLEKLSKTPSLFYLLPKMTKIRSA